MTMYHLDVDKNNKTSYFIEAWRPFLGKERQQLLADHEKQLKGTKLALEFEREHAERAARTAEINVDEDEGGSDEGEGGTRSNK